MDKIINKEKKILVAMSGGLDSSVTAALLKKKGFSVAGVFMKFWSHPTADETEEGFNRCCGLEAENRARSVADILKIPFYVLDFKDDFKREVVDRFIAEYKKARTPNPCVDCNETIKLGLLLDKAVLMGFDLVATGHYVKIVDGKIYRAKDLKKDQSYFLWKLKSDQIDRLIFPLADCDKEEVKLMAEDFNLPLSGIKESMEVCFIKESLGEFLSHYLGTEPGDIVDENGRVIGRHSGLWFHTIGQRKGIGLSGGPYFVVGKDCSDNILKVSKNKIDLEKNTLKIESVNWISEKPDFPFKADVQLRYGHKASPATLDLDGDEIKIVFEKPQKAITSGQSAVIYIDDWMLGGGVIV